jgi:hypothetical protein
MKKYTKLTITFLTFLSVMGFGLMTSTAELIEPSRSLKSTSGGPGQLTIFSEPPGMVVKLDGTSVGSAPIRIKSLNPGVHRLQVGKSATEITIEPGQTIHISLFRNRFIQFQADEKQDSQTADTGDPSKTDRRISETPPQQYGVKEENRKAWERWMRFVDGTTRHF